MKQWCALYVFLYSSGKIWPRVRLHMRFVRNTPGFLHFCVVTFQQEWSHGMHCGAVHTVNQANMLTHTRCQICGSGRCGKDVIRQTSFRLYTAQYVFLGNAPCVQPVLSVEICPQPHAAHVTVALSSATGAVNTMMPKDVRYCVLEYNHKYISRVYLCDNHWM